MSGTVSHGCSARCPLALRVSLEPFVPAGNDMWLSVTGVSRWPISLRSRLPQFTLLEQYDPRVPAGDARELMAKLAAAGLSAREVARRTGISPDTAARAAQGVGKVRYSTVAALDELAASLNGGRGRRRSKR
jgi:hypothetical protein